ncbi:hypothetical protein [Dialister invisus]
MRKMRNGSVARSEESIIRMTSYGLPHHGSKPSSLLRVTPDRLPSFSTFS